MGMKLINEKVKKFGKILNFVLFVNIETDEKNSNKKEWKKIGYVTCVYFGFFKYPLLFFQLTHDADTLKAWEYS